MVSLARVAPGRRAWRGDRARSRPMASWRARRPARAGAREFSHRRPARTPRPSSRAGRAAAAGPRRAVPPVGRALRHPPGRRRRHRRRARPRRARPSPPPCSTTRSRTPASTLDEIERGVRPGGGARSSTGSPSSTGSSSTRRRQQQAATIRKMLVAMANDWRVLLIKLADRLHNMRTLAVMPEWKQRRTAQETFDVYAPLAHRLGVQQVRWQLEDLAFATLHPKRYAEIEQMVAARAPQREEYLARVLVAVRERLVGTGIEAEVTGRPKHLWSIYEKMVVRGKEFDDIHDLVGIRVVVGLREGLLGRARGHPRHLAAGAGAVQGLHQHAEVQPLPVAAHHGDRARRQADRGPGPHARDAPPGRVRHRRPLGLQGEGGRLLGDGLDAADRRRRRARRPTRSSSSRP